MRTITIHSPSLLAGLALACICLLAVGAQVPGPAQSLSFTSGGCCGSIDPRNAVVIREENGPFTVPAGKLMLMTGFGTPNPYYTTVSIDGVPESYSYKNGEDYARFPSLVPVFAGSTITATGNGRGRVYGFLINA